MEDFGKLNGPYASTLENAVKKGSAIIILLIVVSITPNRVMAGDTMTAQYMLQVWTNPDMALMKFFNGFFQAVHDQQFSEEKVCSPKGATRTTLVEAYTNTAVVLIARDPAVCDKPAVDVAGKILISVFPCS